MEFKILFKQYYYSIIIDSNYKIKNNPITIKDLIQIIAEYSNDYDPSFQYIFQCICGEIISEEIPLKNFNCKGIHLKISNKALRYCVFFSLFKTCEIYLSSHILIIFLIFPSNFKSFIALFITFV